MNATPINPLFFALSDQRNGTNVGTSNTSTTIISTNGTLSAANVAAASGSVVLGQIGESILYYDSQNQTFQL